MWGVPCAARRPSIAAVTGAPIPTTGVFRVCRGVTLAVTSAALAVAAHTAGGGAVPDTGLTVLLTVGVAAIGIAMADRRCSTPAILTLLGCSQAATHVLLSFESMDMHMAMGGAGPHPNAAVMLGAHAVAVLLTAGLLAKADAAVFLVAAVLAWLLPVLFTVPPVPEAPARPLPRVHPRNVVVTVLLRRSNARRGPPVYA